MSAVISWDKHCIEENIPQMMEEVCLNSDWGYCVVNIMLSPMQGQGNP